MGQTFGLGLFAFSASESLTRCQGVNQGWCLIWKLNWVWICFHVHIVVGKIQFLMGCWTEVLSFLLTEATLSSLPYVTLQYGGILLCQSQQERKAASKTWVTVLCSLKCHSIFDIFYLLEVSHKSYPLSRGGDYAGESLGVILVCHHGFFCPTCWHLKI